MFQDWQVRKRLDDIQTSLAKRGRGDFRDHSLTFDIPLMGAGLTSAPVQVEIPGDADFVWCGTAAAMTLSATVVVQPAHPAYMLRFLFHRSGRTLGRHSRLGGINERGWMPVSAFCGTGRRVIWLPYPMIIDSTDLVTVEGFNGTNGNRGMNVTLIGVKSNRARAAA